MTLDPEKLVPYGMAGVVMALVAFLVTIDVVASLPGGRKGASSDPAAARAEPFVIETRREGTGHVVDAELTGPNGNPVRVALLIDTGADVIVLPSSMIRTLGMSEADVSPGQARTAGGRVGTLVGRLRTVRVGDARGSDIEVNFIDDDIYGRDHMPLLGMSFLARFLFTVDDDGGRLVLIPKQAARED